jgi:hypothetical protein
MHAVPFRQFHPEFVSAAKAFSMRPIIRQIYAYRPLPPPRRLSEREIDEAAGWWRSGSDSAEIAHRLEVSEARVANAMRAIRERALPGERPGERPGDHQ